MDYTRIPHFALFRQAGTVIVRVKMDVRETRCKPEACPASYYPRVLHRPTPCEQCSRTRSNSKYSDCDSEFVDNCRPYRSSTARSRYVNACAAVCLVLLVGGLSPQSSAAPHKRNMDRQRRSPSEENSLWGNPCDYTNANTNSKPGEYQPKLAENVALQAKNIFDKTASYRDILAQNLHSYETFNQLLEVWSGTDWLRNFTWFPEEGLPKKKELFKPMPEEYINSLMCKIDEVLPPMYKGLKMVVAGLYSISEDGLSDVILSDAKLKKNISQSMHDVRGVLCYFHDLMRSRNLKIDPLPDSEVPDINKEDKPSYALLVYRDALNYLEYIAQVFDKLSKMDSNNAKAGCVN